MFFLFEHRCIEPLFSDGGVWNKVRSLPDLRKLQRLAHHSSNNSWLFSHTEEDQAPVSFPYRS